MSYDTSPQRQVWFVIDHVHEVKSSERSDVIVATQLVALQGDHPRNSHYDLRLRDGVAEGDLCSEEVLS